MLIRSTMTDSVVNDVMHSLTTVAEELPAGCCYQAKTAALSLSAQPSALNQPASPQLSSASPQPRCLFSGRDWLTERAHPKSVPLCFSHSQTSRYPTHAHMAVLGVWFKVQRLTDCLSSQTRLSPGSVSVGSVV